MVPDWHLLLACRFVIGLSIGGVLVVVCTFVMEMLLPEQRMALRAFFNWVCHSLIGKHFRKLGGTNYPVIETKTKN